jgi:RNA polymerase sigma factor (sigma-70 family)
MDADDVVRAVYDASYARLVVQMTAWCGNRAEAEDAVQEAFMQAIMHRRRFAELPNKEAWLRTVATNRLRNKWRRGAIARRLLPQLAPPLSPEVSPNHVAVVAALASLSPDLRRTAVLFYIADLSVAAVAQELGIPEGTVKARLSRCRTKLADLLSEREGVDHA